MIVMNNKVFVEKLRHIASLPTIYYSVAGGDWAKWNGRSWNFDCVILVKAILWGWSENKNHPHGGANYGSNGVYDDGTEQIINRCYNVSSDFSKIDIGELLWLDGHVGIYIGNNEVIECTAGWSGGVLYSKIGRNGERTRNGVQIYSWKKHGKLPYIEYLKEQPTSEPDYTGTITYQAYTNKWLPEVNKSDDTNEGYAGLNNEVISGFRCKAQYGELIYKAHTKNGVWLDEVNSKDYSKNDGSSYAGLYNIPIDMIKIKSTKGWVKYRVKTIEDGWLEWVESKDYNNNDVNSYAGIPNHTIIGIQMY